MLGVLVGQLVAEISVPGVRKAEVRQVGGGGLGGWIFRSGRPGRRAIPKGRTWVVASSLWEAASGREVVALGFAGVKLAWRSAAAYWRAVLRMRPRPE